MGAQSTFQCQSGTRVFSELGFLCLWKPAVSEICKTDAHVPPTSGHNCLILGNRFAVGWALALANSFLDGSQSKSGIGIKVAFSWVERGGRHWDNTDSAANQFGGHTQRFCSIEYRDYQITQAGGATVASPCSEALAATVAEEF
jgi:hypothetical protein